MHLSFDDFIKIVNGDLEKEEKEKFNKHLIQCQECSSNLLEISKMNFFIKNIYLRKVKTILFHKFKNITSPLFLFFQNEPEYELNFVPVKGAVTSIKSNILKIKLDKIFIKITNSGKLSILSITCFEDTKVFIIDKDGNIFSTFKLKTSENVKKEIILHDFTISTITDEVRVIF